jgi:hypothetical protein
MFHSCIEAITDYDRVAPGQHTRKHVYLLFLKPEYEDKFATKSGSPVPKWPIEVSIWVPCRKLSQSLSLSCPFASPYFFNYGDEA